MTASAINLSGKLAQISSLILKSILLNSNKMELYSTQILETLAVLLAPPWQDELSLPPSKPRSEIFIRKSQGHSDRQDPRLSTLLFNCWRLSLNWGVERSELIFFVSSM